MHRLGGFLTGIKICHERECFQESVALWNQRIVIKVALAASRTDTGLAPQEVYYAVETVWGEINNLQKIWNLHDNSYCSVATKYTDYISSQYFKQFFSARGIILQQGWPGYQLRSSSTSPPPTRRSGGWRRPWRWCLSPSPTTASTPGSGASTRPPRPSLRCESSWDSW